MFKGQQFNLRVCIKCFKEYTPLSSVQKVCFECRKIVRNEYKKNWRKENKEHDNHIRKEWYWSNLEKVRSYKRRWNNTKGVEYRKKYYLNKRLEMNNRLKQYKDECNNRIAASRLVKKLGWERVCKLCKNNEKLNVHH